MELLNYCKVKLGITHTKKDSAILSDIATARAELIRSGVSEELAMSEDPLIVSAIATYIQREYLDDFERYDNSFKFQLDNIRKTVR